MLARLPHWVPFVSKPPVFLPPAPDRPLWVIGDVHGCDTLLAQLLAEIAARTPPDTADIVLTGDYIDRGDSSRQVLARLHALCQNSCNATCLMGNHEQMLFDFLHDPATYGRHWLRHGGIQTLESYGLSGPTGTDRGAAALSAIAAKLRTAMGPDVLSWLNTRPLQWRSGNVVVAHAALDPNCAPEDQTRGTLLWGHPLFLTRPRRDGLWVVHGHTIVNTPGAYAAGRIAVDTGAYRSGRLTAALILPGGSVTVLST